MNEKDYIKGFNYGYEFKQHKPLLFETVSNGLQEDTLFRQGFRDGGKEVEKERLQQQIKQRMEGTREKGQGRGDS